MRVLILSQNYWPEPVPKPSELAEALAARGHAVSVVTGFPNYPGGRVYPGFRLRPVKREQARGVRVIRSWLYPYHGDSALRRCLNYGSFMLSAVVGSLFAPPCDVIYVWHPPLTIGIAAWLIGRLKRAPVVYDVQDIWPDSLIAAGQLTNRLIIWAMRQLERFVYKRARRILVVTAAAKANLVAKGVPADKITVTGPWIDERLFIEKDRVNGVEIRAQYGFGDRFVVMYAGNMGRLQGLDTVVRCAALLRPEPDILFVLVGDGVERGALRAQVEQLRLPNVVLVDRQPMSAMPAWLSSADVLVVHLKASPLSELVIPGKTSAYLAAARPVIMASEGAAAGLVAQARAGIVISPENPTAMADAVRRLSRLAPAEREQLGENGRRYVLTHFSKDKVLEDYERIFVETWWGTRTSRLKRSFDVLLSGLGVLASFPLWVLIAGAIKIGDRGPIFYSQERVGRGGRRFRSWKFRSMIPASDTHFGPLQAKDADTRITRVGRLLRATALDELPQLWNIFWGDMSFVGPRALMPEEIEVNGAGRIVPLEKIAGYETRHRVTPGLTGVAQIYAARDIPRRHKFKFDRLYIRKQNFWLDIRLIALSFWITFRGKWAYRGRKL